MSDWLDLLTRKKNFEYLFNHYGIDETSINNEIIEESFVGINEVLSKFKENEKYFSRFVFYLYNYERWFFMVAIWVFIPPIISFHPTLYLFLSHFFKKLYHILHEILYNHKKI